MDWNFRRVRILRVLLLRSLFDGQSVSAVLSSFFSSRSRPRAARCIVRSMQKMAAIAVPFGAGWQGVVHRLDPLPRHLGSVLWRFCVDELHGDGRALASLVVESAAGWDSVLESDLFADPFVLSPAVELDQYLDALTSRRPLALPVGEPVLSCGCPFDASNCRPHEVQWVYVLNSRSMNVVAALSWEDGPPAHRLLTSVPFAGPEPLWEELERFAGSLGVPVVEHPPLL